MAAKLVPVLLVFVLSLADSETRFPGNSQIKYGYKASIEQFQPSTESLTGMEMSCTVIFNSLPNTNNYMQLRGCSFTQHTNERMDFHNTPEMYFFKRVEDLERYDIMFELDVSGSIELFANKLDSTRSLNVKRGILSMIKFNSAFLNQQGGKISEETLYGVCATEYSNKSENELVIKNDFSVCNETNINIAANLLKLSNNFVNITPIAAVRECHVRLQSPVIVDQVNCEEVITSSLTAGESHHRSRIKQQLKLITIRHKVIEQRNLNNYTPTTLQMDLDIGLTERDNEASMRGLEASFKEVSQNNVIKPKSWLEWLKDIWTRMAGSSIDLPDSFTAIVNFNGIIRTFDGKVYEMPDYPSPECAYLLTKDIHGLTYSLVQQQEQVTLLVSGDTSITITKEGRIDVNNYGNFSTELPFVSKSGKVTATRTGFWIHVDTGAGFRMKCNTREEFCTYTLDGTLQNKTVGLLGSNDNEPSNDLRTRSGHITTNVGRVVNSFELSTLPVCRRNSNHHLRGLCRTAEARNACTRFYSAETPGIASCLSVVNPKPYIKLCETHLSVDSCMVNNNSPKGDQGICASAISYANACTQHGVTVSLEPCMSCEHGRRVGEEWDERFSNNVDIVVITSLADPEGENPADSLFHIIHTLRRQLRDSGAGAIRLGLLAYGGDGEIYDTPHAYTFDADLFTHSIIRVRQKLNLLSFNAKPETLTNEGDIATLLATYPYRNRAVKIALFVTYSHVNPQVDMRSTDILRKLSSHNIILSSIELESSNFQHQPAGRISRPQAVDQNLQYDLDSGLHPQFQLTLHNSQASTLRIMALLTQHILSYSTGNYCQKCSCSVDVNGQPVSKCVSSKCQTFV